MRWRQLEAFRETMVTGTARGAAEIMGISQPAVSRLIEGLERSLQITLFDRSSGRLVPTAEAQLFHVELQKAFANYDRLRTVAMDIRSGRRGSLHIASMPALGLGFLPDVIAEFARLQPDVRIRYDLQLSARVEALVSAQMVDLGIAEFPFERPGFEREEFCQVPYVLALPDSHRLSARPVIGPADLEGVDLVSLGMDTVAGRMLDACFARAGVVPRIIWETTFSAGVCALVQRGMGVGLVDMFTAHDMRGKGLVFRRFEPELMFNVGVLYPRHQPLSRTAAEFVGTLRNRRNWVLARTAEVLGV
jgi:DNA-binding transcriptional LysR family regulator